MSLRMASSRRRCGSFNLLDALMGVTAACALLPPGHYAYRLITQQWNPQITAVEPVRVRQIVDSRVFINGLRFDRWSRVAIDGQPVPVRFVNPRRLEVTLPVELPQGLHAVQVTTFQKRVATLEQAFQVVEPPPQIAARLGVVCLLVGITPEQMQKLSELLQTESHRESDSGVYFQRFCRSGLVEPKQAAKWLLINVHVSGVMDYVTNPPRFRYQNRFMEPGEPIELELGSLRLQGWVASGPQLIRVLGGATR